MDNNGFSEPPLFFPVGGISIKTKRWLFFFFVMSSHGLHNLWASICPLSVLQESVTEQPHQVGG